MKFREILTKSVGKNLFLACFLLGFVDSLYMLVQGIFTFEFLIQSFFFQAFLAIYFVAMYVAATFIRYCLK